MKTDPIPVWQFFEIPENGIDLCYELAKEYSEDSREKLYWLRAAEFLGKFKSQTADQLDERDFDWMLKLRVLFEKDETVAKIRSHIDN
jgi:hypothetical protein